jgi:glycosyltransferase involved in cell wall biosynthesis
MSAKSAQKIEYPVIDPVPEGTHRPFWSVMIPTYNCADYLVQTLESVLAQDPGPEHMQIEVIDDCSTKDVPEAVVREIGKGRVSFYRQPKNGGATNNFNTCIQRSIGHYVHILHGDDYIAPDFYESLCQLIRDLSNIALLICPSTYVDENGTYILTEPSVVDIDGQAIKFTELQATRNRVQTPGAIVARWAYESIGGFNTSLSHCADWEMWFRASLAGETFALNDSKSFYRVHSKSDSSKLVQSGKTVEESAQTVDILFEMLPEDLRNKLLQNKYSWIAERSISNSQNFYSRGQWDVSLIHAKLACKFSPSIYTLRNYLKVFLKKQANQFF